jgi:hypothetical protein
MRIGIRDLADPLRGQPMKSPFAVQVAIDGTACCGGAAPCGAEEDPPVLGTPDPSGLPLLRILSRAVSYADEEGTPRYAWTPVLTGIALLTEERTELNDATGQTMVKRSAVVGWSGEPQDAPAETAVAEDEQGNRWEITSLVALPGRIELQMQRIADAP